MRHRRYSANARTTQLIDVLLYSRQNLHDVCCVSAAEHLNLLSERLSSFHFASATGSANISTIPRYTVHCLLLTHTPAGPRVCLLAPQRGLAGAAAPAPALGPAEEGAGAAAQQGDAQPAQPSAAVRLPVQLSGPGRYARHAGPQWNLHPGHQAWLGVPPLLCQALCSVAGHKLLPCMMYSWSQCNMQSRNT